MKALIVVVGLAVVAAVAFADEPAVKAKPNAGFEKLKTLAGNWHGKMTEGDVKISYRIVAAGNAVEETMSHGDMVTMYHVDGPHLMLTHYCAAGNQPRMRAAAFKDSDTKLAFNFHDATNMPDKKAEHMHSLTLTFKDADHIQQEWSHFNDGKATGKVVIDLERVK